MVYHRTLNSFLCYYSRTLLFIHPIYNSLHLLTPHSQPFLPLPTSFLATTSLFSMSLFQITHFSGPVKFQHEN